MSPRSSALAGAERVGTDRERPEYASTHIPPHRRPLPLMVADAVHRPETETTRARLSLRTREWDIGRWPGARAEQRERAAYLRRRTLADLEGNLARLTENIEANGGVVHRAKDAAEALAAIERIVTRRQAQLAVKSKSMVSEEIHLNDHLTGLGVEVVETDLGEYIVQIADERPAHIVAPAVHLSRTDVGRRFSAIAGRDLGDDPDDLAAFAREQLREDFRNADVGISGVNFAVAETGTLALVTNEGNADMVTSQPPVHIAVMTLEKVVQEFADLETLLPILSKAGANQEITVYQTLVNGPRREGETDGPEELHVVILDGGRSDIVGTRYEEALACIRCGACQTACPVFGAVGGGHAYGNVYGGPIGAVITPLLSDRPEDRDLPYLSSLCGACGDACPVKIPLPDMLVDLRADYQEETASPATRAAWRAWARTWASRAGFAATIAGARASAVLPERVLRRLPMAGGWARGRSMPSTKDAGQMRRRRRDGGRR
ncbi:LUD domain-containing protein [Ornithinicoccus halotolerans]|uniref:LUD domain-containing protein n=1 Tax=Ornithinicoccus halotolerans TaxID=1748220 RepID=UPI0012950900|nr:lactate utilization protein B [Ornithinicoccus halotolerans]